jgi:hypothetical protein
VLIGKRQAVLLQRLLARRCGTLSSVTTARIQTLPLGTGALGRGAISSLQID